MNFLRLVCAGAALALPAVAAAQAYPDKPVRVIVPVPAGGTPDVVARMVAPALIAQLGQQLVIDNRGGAGGLIGAELAARATPDGYTLFFSSPGPLTILPHLQKKVAYDTLRDFAPVSHCVTGANVLSVHPSLPAKNLKELIALAKARPGQLRFGSSGIGSSNQMAGELLKMMAGIDIEHVPYKGNAPALTDTIGGHIEMMFSGVPSLLPHIQSGRLRGIAIGSLKRFPALPNTPTFDESGLKGYEATTWFGLMAPVKTPRDIVVRLSVETDKILKSQEVRERFLVEGLEPIGGTPESFAQFIRVEIDKYAKVVKAGNLKGE